MHEDWFCADSDGESISSFVMVLWTSAFCFALTSVLLFYCHLNPPSELELLLDVAPISAHKVSLKRNRNSLQKVSVKAFEEYDESELLPIFKELAHIPRLVALTVDLLLPVNVLAYLLDNSKNLQELFLHFQLSGSNRDFVTLAKSIQKHPALKTVSIESCDFDATRDASLGPLIHSLANLRTLQTFSIYNLRLSPVSFTTLLQSTYIQTLVLSNIPMLSSCQITQLASNTALRSLVAPLHAGTEAAWEEALQQNISLLKLKLNVEERSVVATYSSKNSTIIQYQDRFLPIARALATNTSLQSLSLDVNENFLGRSSDAMGLSLESMLEIATSLKRNKTLKALTIGRCRNKLCSDSPAVLELIEAIRQNYTLESFALCTTGSRILIVPEIEFYSKCNRHGRGDIIKANPSKGGSVVANFLVRHKADVSTTFHVLTEKPGLLQYCIPR